uniref:Uncharacterized protein n=1 Tax=Alexandrium monilatum TaxID=311494 RepID=A0A7S4T7B4_9DINO
MGSLSPSAGRSGIALAMAGRAAAEAFVAPSRSSAVQGSGLPRLGGAPRAGEASGSPSAALGSATAALGACMAAVVAGGRARRAGARPAVRRSAAARAAFDPAREAGAVEPLGYFDPLGFAQEGDAQGFRILRMAELKHGRVAMMASIGLVAQHFLKLPGAEDVPAGIGAMNTAVGQVGFGAIFAWSGVMENTWKDDPSREAGNFGDPFGIGMYDKDMRNKEINNGRFAMIAVLGIIGAELATGKDAIQQFGL